MHVYSGKSLYGERERKIYYKGNDGHNLNSCLFRKVEEIFLKKSQREGVEKCLNMNRKILKKRDDKIYPNIVHIKMVLRSIIVHILFKVGHLHVKIIRQSD